MRTRLSVREREVLERSARGLQDAEVARELGISLGTTRVYIKRACVKYGGLPRQAVILAAWQAGEIDLRRSAALVTGADWPERDILSILGTIQTDCNEVMRRTNAGKVHIKFDGLQDQPLAALLFTNDSDMTVALNLVADCGLTHRIEAVGLLP